MAVQPPKKKPAPVPAPAPQPSYAPQPAPQVPRPSAPRPAPAPSPANPAIPGNTQRPPLASPQPDQPSPAAPRPPANPGPQHYDDKYGGGNRNTNAAGVQSNGDDDPWSIGAFQGGTYDPEKVLGWISRAQQGDGGAAWLLRQIDLSPQDGSLENWAQRRGLKTRDEAFGPGGQYSQQATQRDVQPTGGVARDQGNQGGGLDLNGGKPIDTIIRPGDPDPYGGGQPGGNYGDQGNWSGRIDNPAPMSYMPEYPAGVGGGMSAPVDDPLGAQQGGSRGRSDYFDPAILSGMGDPSQQGNTSKPGLYDDPQPVPDVQAQDKPLVKPYFDWKG